MKTADLHTHSYYSDGIYSPRKVVGFAKEKGIKYLALTDHNSVKGVKEAIKEGKKLGVIVIPAVELRSKEGEILGYFIDTNDKLLNQTIKEIIERTEQIFKKLLKKLKEKSINVKINDVLDTKIKKQNVLNVYLYRYLKKKLKIEIKEVKIMVRKLISEKDFEPRFSSEEIIKVIIK